jgi:hypothetical protein
VTIRLLRRLRDLLWDTSHAARRRDTELSWTVCVLAKRAAVRIERIPGVGPRPFRPFPGSTR